MSLKKSSRLLLALFFIHCSPPTTRDLLFDPFGLVRWNSTINVNKDFTVQAGDSLLVEAGTIVRFERPNDSILILGDISISGTRVNPVTFLGNSNNTLYVYGTSKYHFLDNVHLSNMTLSFRGNAYIYDSKIPKLETLESATLYISYSLLGKIVLSNQSKIFMDFSTIDTFPFPSFSNPSSERYKNLKLENNSYIKGKYNNILGYKENNDPQTNLIVLNYSSSNIDLKNNYWNQTNTNTITSNILFKNGANLILIDPIRSTPGFSGEPWPK